MKRTMCLVTMLLTFMGVTGIVSAPAQAHDRAAIEGALLQLINNMRANHGLHAVKLQSKLDSAAIAHSRQMLSRDYFSHDSAGGASYAQRLRAAGYTRSGYRHWSVGEVIGWGKGSAGTAKAIFNAWMHSSAHRTVILTGRWRDVGVGCGEGTFRGLAGTLMYTVDFGRRSR
jgi:uncharacterized protein YkwD